MSNNNSNNYNIWEMFDLDENGNPKNDLNKLGLDKLADLIMEKLENKIEKVVNDKVAREIEDKINMDDKPKLGNLPNMNTMDLDKAKDIYGNYQIAMEDEEVERYFNERLNLMEKLTQLNIMIEQRLNKNDSWNNISQNLVLPEMLVNNEIDLSGKIEIQNDLGRYIKLSGLTQSDIAEKIGVNKGTLSNIINGKYSTSLDIALKLSKLLGIPVENLFWLDENTK